MVAKDTWYILGAVAAFGAVIIFKQGNAKGWLGSGEKKSWPSKSGWLGSKGK